MSQRWSNILIVGKLPDCLVVINYINILACFSPKISLNTHLIPFFGLVRICHYTCSTGTGLVRFIASFSVGGNDTEGPDLRAGWAEGMRGVHVGSVVQPFLFRHSLIF